MALTRVRSQLITIPTNSPLTGSLSGTASYATTASYALNGGTGGGGTLQTGSIAGQTILYNFSSSQEATITGLNLSNNKWGISVVEEWNSASIVGDVYYNSCSLLMHFSGSNGSTTFIDNSQNTLTVTSNNGAAISTAQSKFGSSSGYFDGTDDYLTIPSSTVFDFGSGDFTVEFWIKTTQTTSNVGLIVREWVSSPWSGGWVIQLNGNSNSAMTIYWADYSSSSPFMTANTTSYRDGNWHHIAWVRNGTSFNLYIDGISVATATSSTSFASVNKNITIGEDLTFGPRRYLGYMDELRVTKGIARYTGSFTTQSAEFLNYGTLNQYETKYIGLIGGLNDTGSDYGVQKLNDTSLKIRKMSVSGTPVSGSPILSSSVDRVYVNVLNYDNVAITASNSISSSYTLTASYALNTSGGGTTNWTSSNLTSSVSTSSIAAFNSTGSPILVSPPSDNTYLVYQNGILKWIPIASVAVSILNSTFSENESIIDGLYESAITSVAFVSSFTSGSI